MSITIPEQQQAVDLQAEVADLQCRLAELEREVERLKAEPVPRPAGDWRAALERLQQGWVSMDPGFQEECLASLEEAERCSRAARVAE